MAAVGADNSSTVQLEKHDADDTTKRMDKMNISFSIWPPTQRTRDAVTKGLVETLSTTSILSKRYGTLPTEEATTVAESIEAEALAAASASSLSADDHSIEILQAYSKEISKRMIDYMKTRSASPATSDVDSSVTTTTAVYSAAHDEERVTVDETEF